MKEVIFFILLLSFARVVFPFTEENLNCNLISDTLKEDAVAVVRFYNIDYTIKNKGLAVLKVKKAITILKKEGDDFAHVMVPYDKNSKIISFSGEIYDEKGERIRKIKNSEVNDNSYVSSYSLYEDNRFKYFEAFNHTYPFTVVSEYVVEYDGLLSYRTWVPVPGYEVAVESSDYTISSPSNLEVRFKPINLEVTPEKQNIDGRTVYHYKIAGTKAKDSEPFSPPFLENMPVLWSAPLSFKFEGTTGDMSSWESFGKWSLELISGRQELPESTVNYINKLVKGITDEKEKARILYEYMQKKTRYVSIQLGIGGWQPFPASTVDELGYGDCKALSNYMKALLNAVGIESYYTVIGNGSTKIKYPDFPNLSQTNHVILCLPFENDTTWLECTSNSYPFGYLGKSNCNRYAHAITLKGGKLIKTPSFRSNENVQARKVFVDISENGNAKVSVETKFSGLQYENRVHHLDQNEDDKKIWLLKNLQLANPVLQSFSYDNIKNQDPTITEHLDFILPEYTSKVGNRVFLKLNLMNYVSSPPDKVKERKFDVVRNMGYKDIDSVFYQIPDGYILEASVDNAEINSDFGVFSIEVIQDGDKIIYIRNIEMFEGRWPASRYEEFREFYKNIWKLDKSKIVYKINT